MAPSYVHVMHKKSDTLPIVEITHIPTISSPRLSNALSPSNRKRGKEAATQATQKEGRRPPRKSQGKREGGHHTTHTERGKEAARKEGATQATRKEGRRAPQTWRKEKEGEPPSGRV